MTTGRPSISPQASHNQPLVSGLGAEAVGADMEEDDDFLCRVCDDQCEVFGVEDGQEEIEASLEEEQAVKVRPLPTPYQPTLSQFLDHCVTHYPYQSWCPYCVEGKGREFGHRATEKESCATPIVSFDYVFLSDNEDIETQQAYEDAGEGAVKLLVVFSAKAALGDLALKKGEICLQDGKGPKIWCSFFL